MYINSLRSMLARGMSIAAIVMVCTAGARAGAAMTTADVAAQTLPEILPLKHSVKCRCLPLDPCWPSSAEWLDFNQSVHGRLQASVDEVGACIGPKGSEKNDVCVAQLNQTDDEFWIADQPRYMYST